MGKIVAIGGGDMVQLQTLPIDRRIVRLTGRKRPNALFIPTASSDSREYWEGFRAVYEGQLRCHAEVLFLLGDKPDPRDVARRIRCADLIYVGGGNTLKMMRRWRYLGVDQLLLRAYRKGTVLSGLSAGCLCWFDWGHSDSMCFYHPDDWDYVRVRGLGLIPALGCPHYDGEKRDQSFEAMVKRHGDVGIALDNHAALEVVDGEYRIITSASEAGAYRVTREWGRVRSEAIPQRRKPTALRTLLEDSDAGR
jgi:dipeptidase E